MAFQLFEIDEEDSLNAVLVAVIAEIALICATALVFFAYLKLPLSLATALSLFVFFLGSLACWKGFGKAQMVFFISIMACEFVLVSYFDWLLPGFIVFDLIAVLVFMRIWQPRNEEAEAEI